jgi:hypothetical protein
MMRTRRASRVLVFVAVVLGLGFALVSQAVGDSPSQEAGISAMVKLEPNAFLLANDRKGDQEGVRLKVLSIRGGFVWEQPLPIEDLPSEAEPPSDLEAACAVPGRAAEYLVAESGFYEGKYGRILLVRIEREGGDWAATLKGSFTPFPQPAADYSTPKAEQIEGMGCVRTGDGKLRLVLARRGAKSKAAVLVWGTLDNVDTSQPSFAEEGQATLTPAPGPLGDRSAADVYLKPASDDAWRVWSVATVDQGNLGPFRSLIYDAGKLAWDSQRGLAFVGETLRPLWALEGIKVEALADAPGAVDNSVITIGTDDESYGGIWRPLLKPQDN